MSGDVQPRKRKDKRRKKEGGSLGSIHDQVSSHKFSRNDDDQKVYDLPDKGEKIHVQSEHGVGGNICIKIIFFCLFGLLIGAVGLIYIKSQGSTDVDLPTIEESRFAEYFTGWLDDGVDDHDHEPLDHNVDLSDPENDHEENNEQDNDEEEEQVEEAEEESTEQDTIYKLFGLQDDESEQVEETEMKANKATETVQSKNWENAEEDEEDEGDVENSTEEGEEEEEEEENQTNMEEDEEANDWSKEETKENENERNSGIDELKNEETDTDDDLLQMDEDDEDMYNASQDDDGDGDKVENSEAAEVNEADISDEERKDQLSDGNGSVNEDNDIEDNLEEEDDDEKEEVEEKLMQKLNAKSISEKEENDDMSFEEIEISEEYLEIKSVDKNKEKVLDDQLSKRPDVKSKETELGIEEETDETESGGVALKLGVGIALIIVAHLVLVKKWKSMSIAQSNENASPISETQHEKKESKTLQSSVEPLISRTQILIHENICYESEEEMEEEEDENEVLKEKREHSLVKKGNNWETSEKPLMKLKNNKSEENEEFIDNEVEVEEEEVEEEEEEDEEDDEDDDDDYEEEEEVDEERDSNETEDDDVDEEGEQVEEKNEEEEDFENIEDFMKHKIIPPVEENEEPPKAPPRTRTVRGAQEFDEDIMDHFREQTDKTDNSDPEDQKASKNKVGNEDEWTFQQELDFADEQLENKPKTAVRVYNNIISKKPALMRALVGRARALDRLAEKEKSNIYLNQAIQAYRTVLLNHERLLDDETYIKLAERSIERMRFAGALVSAIDIHKALILKYPNTPKYRNALSVTYLMLNKIPQAKVLLNETLSLWPDDGFALVHYGFILKTSDNDMEEGAKKLMAGIKTGQEGVIDGTFFFHLGDALNRLGRKKEAMEWYELGVKKGLFLSKYQRSLYNVNRLKGQPWWSKEETTYQNFFRKLEDNWREIRREGLELLNLKNVNLFKDEAENLKDTGDWKQLDLYFRGRKQPSCNKAPVTCSLVSSFKPAATCTRGQIKFSVMLPNTHVWPHCGPTNCRLRSHLGLVVPKGTFIRVAEEMRSWEEGKFIIFDDSFEHEVWHNGTGLRLVLIVDVWHPELTSDERRHLSPI